MLQPLALWLHEKDQRRSAPLAEIKEVIKQPLEEIRKSEINSETLLQNIRDRSGIFVGYSETEYGFAHLSFQEYLAAEEVRNKNRLDLLVKKYGDRWWREVLLLCLALDNPSVITPFMEKLIPTNKFGEEISLVLDAIRDSISKPVQPFIAAMGDESLPTACRANAVRALAAIGGPKVIEALRPVAQGKGQSLALAAYEALASLGAADGLRKPEIATARITHPKDGAEMVLIPAVSFLYGSREDDEMARSDEKPQRVIELPAFYMDVYPVTNEQYCRFLQETTDKTELTEWINLAGSYEQEKCRISKTPTGFTVEAGYERHPVIYVSWFGANAYARWAGKRLSTEEEWEKAARGTDGRRWPWGNEFDQKRCNTVEGGLGHTSPVGQFPTGASPYGCQDMAGNVWEWTDSWYDKNKRGRVLRGGSWSSYRDYARCAYRNGYNPNSRSFNVGFRCARAVE